MTTNELDELRQNIKEVDEKILKLVSERMKYCRQVGEYKKRSHQPVKDYKVEKVILERTKKQASELAIDPGLAETLAKSLIQFSVLEQEEIKANFRSVVKGDSCLNVLVIGGLGNMGLWMSQFFESIGHNIKVLDTGAQSRHYLQEENLNRGSNWAELIVLATPMESTNSYLKQLAKLKTDAIIVEITSLKSPIAPGISAVKEANLKLVCIHPMFGPDTQILSGKNIIFCEAKAHDASFDSIVGIFAKTSANIVRIPLSDHDAYMSYILGSAHLLNLIYAKTLDKSGFPLPSLETISGTTFDNQIAVTKTVVKENQDLYFDIQSLNPQTSQLMDLLTKTINEFKTMIVSGDRESFKTTMTEAADYFGPS